MSKENIKKELQDASNKLRRGIDDSIRDFVEGTGLIPKIKIEYIDASGSGSPVMLPMLTISGLVPVDSDARVF